MLLADEQMAVIDAGIPDNGDAIIKYIRNIGRSPNDLRWIIVTHFHFDHSGSAAELRELTGAQVVAHKAEIQQNPDGRLFLRKGTEGEPPPGWYRWIFARGRRPTQEVEIHETEVDLAVEEGETIPCFGGLRIIHAPGHTPGSITPLLQDPHVLFLGDSVLNNVDRLSRPLTWDSNKRRQIDGSLHNLRDLEASLACFGHGPPLAEQVMNRIRALTDRPYDMPTWRIALKNWQTLRRFRDSTRQPGNWSGAKAEE